MARWSVALLAIATLLMPLSASAEPDCRPASNLGPGLRKLIQEFHGADQAGSAELSVQDFLAGVTKIKPDDQVSLDHRGIVRVARTAMGQGSVRNEGKSELQFDALFAGRQTFFRIPQSLKARYVAQPNSVTLFYDADNALHLGEAIPLVGIPVFRTVNHVAITADKLLFFWGDNSSDQPDRCYVPS